MFYASTKLSTWLSTIGETNLDYTEEEIFCQAFPDDFLENSDELALYQFLIKLIDRRFSTKSKENYPDFSLLALPYPLPNKEEKENILKNQYILGFGCSHD